MVEKTIDTIGKSPLLIILLIITCGGGSFGIGRFTASAGTEDVKRENAVLQEKVLTLCNQLTDVKSSVTKIDIILERQGYIRSDVEILKKQLDELKRMMKISGAVVSIPVCETEVDDGTLLQMPGRN